MYLSFPLLFSTIKLVQLLCVFIWMYDSESIPSHQSPHKNLGTMIWISMIRFFKNLKLCTDCGLGKKKILDSRSCHILLYLWMCGCFAQTEKKGLCASIFFSHLKVIHEYKTALQSSTMSCLRVWERKTLFCKLSSTWLLFVMWLFFVDLLLLFFLSQDRCTYSAVRRSVKRATAPFWSQGKERVWFGSPHTHAHTSH